MAKRVEIRANLANLLTYIGSLYRNPADALKEYVSNALDEWQKGPQSSPCTVEYSLQRNKITIDYNQPGMKQDEFEGALRRVADSVKPDTAVSQIGQLGIGIFAFNQVGRKCTFLSRSDSSSPTLKVVLRTNSDEAEFEIANKRERLAQPGMRIYIEQLTHDPLKPRGPLSIQRLSSFFSDKFDAYLRSGVLDLTIRADGQERVVKARQVRLRRIGLAFSKVPLPRNRQKTFSCQFWFDPQGKSTVSIRHAKVPIVSDLKGIEAYGLEESVFASGFVKGYIDADFLKPQPARTAFVEDEDWINFLDELDKMCPSLEAEVDDLRRAHEQTKLTKVQRRALELAREILDSEDFQDLALLGGLRIPRGPKTHTGKSKPRAKTRALSGGGKRRGGPRINYSEVPFNDESPPQKLHCRFVGGQVQANTLNPDYVQEMSRDETSRLIYATLMIGKETIAYNDSSGATNEYLEKLLSFLFQVKTRVGPSALAVSRTSGRSRKVAV